MEINYFDQPEFLFCEILPKDGTFNDGRVWIYHRLSLSLIEFINLDALDDFHFKGIHKDFIYLGTDQVDPEAWKGVFVQNNCEATGKDPLEVMDAAWQYLSNYLTWEDSE